MPHSDDFINTVLRSLGTPFGAVILIGSIFLSVLLLVNETSHLLTEMFGI